MAATANITPARALARLMIAAFAAVVLTLLVLVAVVGVSEPGQPSGATTTAAIVGT